jgi:hypothetical protein
MSVFPCSVWHMFKLRWKPHDRWLFWCPDYGCDTCRVYKRRTWVVVTLRWVIPLASQACCSWLGTWRVVQACLDWKNQLRMAKLVCQRLNSYLKDTCLDDITAVWHEGAWPWSVTLSRCCLLWNRLCCVCLSRYTHTHTHMGSSFFQCRKRIFIVPPVIYLFVYDINIYFCIVCN